MKLQFDPILDFQRESINAGLDLNTKKKEIWRQLKKEFGRLQAGG
jgi:hypothetical protein